MLRDYWTLGKPRVVLLMLITAWVGMFMATPLLPPLTIVWWASIGIALCAFSAGTLNHLLDIEIDKKMERTNTRPLVMQRISPLQASIYAFFCGVTGTIILWTQINNITTLLTVLSLFSYAVIYTLFLKHATPLNIVIGGLAGSTPPLLGWAAVTNSVDPHALLLVLIIFLWTPPHFWALALHRRVEYSKAKVPMLPVTHGIRYTRWQILFYTLLLIASSALPFATGLSGLFYFVVAMILGLIYLYWAVAMLWYQSDRFNLPSFYYSIWYLLLLFMAMLFDHYWRL